MADDDDDDDDELYGGGGGAAKEQGADIGMGAAEGGPEQAPHL